MADEAQETAKQAAGVSRNEREAAVRQKYDFSVIRSLRQQKGLTIEKFAKLCGLSYAPISRIETNLIKPNLDTLDKIATGLGIRTHALVGMAERRSSEHFKAQLIENSGFSVSVFTTSEGEMGYGSMLEGAESQDLGIRSGDIETLIVQNGRVEVHVDDVRYELAAGEALRYDRVYPHSVKALEPTSFIVVSRAKLRGK